MEDNATRDMVIIVLASCIIAALWTAGLTRGFADKLAALESDVAALKERTAPMRFDNADLMAFVAEAGR